MNVSVVEEGLQRDMWSKKCVNLSTLENSNSTTSFHSSIQLAQLTFHFRANTITYYYSFVGSPYMPMVRVFCDGVWGLFGLDDDGAGRFGDA